MTGRVRRLGSLLIAAWGVGGVVLILWRAVVRLTPLALEPLRDGSLAWWQGLVYAGWVVLSAYSEGYRGFQRRFSPRVVARALHVGHAPRALDAVLAPAYCMSLFRARRRELVTAWVMVAAIATLVVIIRYIPQPWRGIIDGGVVVGLVWGIAATVVLFVRALPR